jgi:hypothetical protein
MDLFMISLQAYVLHQAALSGLPGSQLPRQLTHLTAAADSHQLSAVQISKVRG